MSNNKYSMSFTTAALLYRESLIVTDLYAELGDWRAVRDKVVGENLLQMRTQNASERICSETISRLKQLTPEQLELLRDGTPSEQRHLLWLAVCNRYRFIHDFAVEILREKFLRLDLELTYEDYDAFFFNKAEWHPEVERVTETTRKKQRQFLFKMMQEAELLSIDRQIIPVLLTPNVIEVIGQDSPAHFAIFPVYDADIKEWATP